MIAILPMAGGNESFKQHGYAYCKPLVEIYGRPLLEWVMDAVRSLAADRYVFVIRKEDDQCYHLGDVIRLMVPSAVVVRANGATAGAACTALLAIEHIAPDEELVIANGDQMIKADLAAAVADFRKRKLDAGTIVFDAVHPRWSFVRVDDNGYVVEAAEKRPISRHATAGFYYFRKGKSFVDAAGRMIRKDAHVNGAFFVCPTFNEMILDHAKIGIHSIPRDAYISLATPQNLEDFEKTIAAGKS